MIDTNDMNLIVSCPNDGGLVRILNGEPVYVDRYSTTGLCFHEGKLFRCLQNSIDTPLEMIVYAKQRNYSLVLPEIRDVHDILSYDGKLFMVSTGSNEIFEVSAQSFEILDRFKLKGKGDAWHLNCLEVHENRLLVSAFGKFRRHRGYKGRTVKAGIVFDLISGKTLYRGFSQPHSPKIIDNRLFICDSEQRKIHRIDLKTGARRSIEFENYTRGIAYSDKYIYIGVSSSRNIAQELKTSKIVVLDRMTLERLHEIRLEFSEIYSICAMPENFQLSLEFPQRSVLSA